jgi:cobalamin synthase
VRLPSNVTPAAAHRRSLLFEALLGIAIGIFAIIVTAGIGVVGFIALLAALVLALWYLVEIGIRVGRRRRARAADHP